MSLEVKVKPEGITFTDVFLAFGEASINFKMSVAASKAMTDAGAALKKEGRANIRAGGLGAKFANAWRVAVYPAKGKPSLDPAAYGRHNIPYATIFETGGTIRGRRGLLWLPLPTVPKVGKRIARPRDLTGVKLFSINSHGTPLLAAKIRNAGANKNSRIRGQVSLPTLRAGTDADKIRKTSRLKAKQRGGVKASNATANAVTVPLFHGVPAVTLRRRFNLAGVAQSVAARVPEFYERHAPKE